MNILNISLKTPSDGILKLKALIGKKIMCLSSHSGATMTHLSESFYKDSVNIFLSDQAHNVSVCSISLNSLFLREYNMPCSQIMFLINLDYISLENFGITDNGFYVINWEDFTVKKITILGVKYENTEVQQEQEDDNQTVNDETNDSNSIFFKVDMDNFVLFESTNGEQILIKDMDRYRLIHSFHNNSRIEKILNEVYFVGDKQIKSYVIQHVII